MTDLMFVMKGKVKVSESNCTSKILGQEMLFGIKAVFSCLVERNCYGFSIRYTNWVKIRDGNNVDADILPMFLQLIDQFKKKELIHFMNRLYFPVLEQQGRQFHSITNIWRK